MEVETEWQGDKKICDWGPYLSPTTAIEERYPEND